MSLFNSILTKLGLKPKPEAGKPSAPPSPKAETMRATPAEQAASSRAAPEPEQIEMVDVVSQLEERAAKNPQELNWKTSIVDLLKLLELDSSYEARKEMAVELGCPADKMDDSAEMNTWLHQKVLQEIAKNGGNIPKELLD